ncbi:MAG: glycyl-radical enzyme activating protein [Bryobacteraceae bacterium]
MTGRIFDIQRFSIQDGPGIRTTVFLKGCPLHCTWCHNPEGISPKPVLSYLANNCIACGQCFPQCPEGALAKAQGGKAAIDRARCTACGRCAAVCGVKALEMAGRDVTAAQVLEVVLRDRDYYAASGGGMTLSGGEPLYQPEFAEALLREAKRADLHCAVETSGFADWRVFERMMPLVDLFLYDCKETDPKLHQGFTGESNEQIRANLRALHAAGAAIVLRCPMIPEYNARREHLDGIAALARELPNLRGVELLPYHRLGRPKVNRFGLVSRMPESVKPPDTEMVRGWIAHLRARGVRLTGQSAPPEARCNELPFPCASPM